MKPGYRSVDGYPLHSGRGRTLRDLTCGAVLVLAGASARAATITVNSTADTAANDGVCTLREAIIAANTNTASGAAAGECAAGAAGLDTIAFAIPGAGVKTITPTSTPPVITEAVFINGYTQGVSSPNTNPLNAGINAVLQIELNCAATGGLTVNAANSVIRGLNVHSSLGDEITVNASNVTIAGNFLGTNPAGTARASGGSRAIRQESGDNNVIGGPNAADRNLMSGDLAGEIFLNSGNGTLIQGNYIGTDITGTLALGAPLAGSTISSNGATNTMLLGNLISGNAGPGAGIQGGGVIQGNLIGTQRDGVSPLGNASGLQISGGFLVGGTSPGQANIIAFNQVGIRVSSNSPGNGILGNSIFSHQALGIVLALGGGNSVPLANDPCDPDIAPGNTGQNYPVITSAVVALGNVVISGTLNSTASTTFRLEFFSNAACNSSGNGEGKTFLGSANVTTNATCDASFGPLVFAVPSGQTVFTATATDPANNTSEFSACFPLGAPPTPTPSPTQTPALTPTPTITPGGATPTATPVGPGGATVPTLSIGMLLLLGTALALTALLLLRRSR